MLPNNEHDFDRAAIHECQTRAASNIAQAVMRFCIAVMVLAVGVALLTSP